MTDRLEDIGSYYPGASLAARNLLDLWERKGNYWEAVEKRFWYNSRDEEGE